MSTEHIGLWLTLVTVTKPVWEDTVLLRPPWLLHISPCATAPSCSSPDTACSVIPLSTATSLQTSPGSLISCSRQESKAIQRLQGEGEQRVYTITIFFSLVLKPFPNNSWYLAHNLFFFFWQMLNTELKFSWTCLVTNQRSFFLMHISLYLPTLKFICHIITQSCKFFLQFSIFSICSSYLHKSSNFIWGANIF